VTEHDSPEAEVIVLCAVVVGEVVVKWIEVLDGVLDGELGRGVAEALEGLLLDDLLERLLDRVLEVVVEETRLIIMMFGTINMHDPVIEYSELQCTLLDVGCMLVDDLVALFDVEVLVRPDEVVELVFEEGVEVLVRTVDFEEVTVVLVVVGFEEDVELLVKTVDLEGVTEVLVGADITMAAMARIRVRNCKILMTGRSPASSTGCVQMCSKWRW
jgi:hypothetical protein